MSWLEDMTQKVMDSNSGVGKDFFVKSQIKFFVQSSCCRISKFSSESCIM